MKKIVYLFCIGFIGMIHPKTFAQTKISANNLVITNTSAVLDLESPNKGLLIPRLSNFPSNPTNGLIFYHMGENQYYVYTNQIWKALDGGRQDLTNQVNNLLPKSGGTMTGKLIINSNLTISTGSPGTGKLLTSNATGNAEWRTSPTSLVRNFPTSLTTEQNFMIGYFNMSENEGGLNNVGIGQYVLQSNTSGNANIGIGNAALQNNTGYENTAIGRFAMNSNTFGYKNVAIGFASLRRNTNGTNNVAIGNESLSYTDFNGSNNIALGFQAGVLVNNSGNIINGLASGNDNILIGTNSLPADPTLHGQLTIANTLFGTNIYDANGGNIGIRTNSPTANLDVNGQLRIRGGNTGQVLKTMAADGTAEWGIYGIEVTKNIVEFIRSRSKNQQTVNQIIETPLTLDLSGDFTRNGSFNSISLENNTFKNNTQSSKYIEIIYNFQQYIRTQNDGNGQQIPYTRYYVQIIKYDADTQSERIVANFERNYSVNISETDHAVYKLPRSWGDKISWEGYLNPGDYIYFKFDSDNQINLLSTSSDPISNPERRFTDKVRLIEYY